jgi:hypothetical protein
MPTSAVVMLLLLVIVDTVSVAVLIALGKDPTVEVAIITPIIAMAVPVFQALTRIENVNAKADDITKHVNGQMSALARHAGIDPQAVGIAPGDAGEDISGDAAK